MEESNQKLIKITKKKNVPSTVGIKIITNNGHSSLVGLSAVVIYGTTGEVVKITENNLKSNPKMSKLFVENG